MNIKKKFQILSQSNKASLSLLVLRIFTGIAFLYHGQGKIQMPFNWIPEGANIHAPALLQFLAAISEFGGGLALILGLVVPLASLGIACTMLYATYIHILVYHDPFINLNGGSSYESPLGYLVIAILLLGCGPGEFSIDRYIFGQKKN